MLGEVGSPYSHLSAHDQGLAVGVPRQGEGLAQTLDLVDAGFGTDVPELDDSVVADGAELGVLDRVEGNLLDRGCVALQLGGKANIGLLWVPWDSRQVPNR